MSTITTKQISFIRSLVDQTGAYDGGEGMVTLDGVYPRVNLEAALAGEATTREASKIIDILLGATKRFTDDEIAARRELPTQKQLSYAAALAQKAGREISFEGMTRKEVSALIDELKTAAYAA